MTSQQNEQESNHRRYLLILDFEATCNQGKPAPKPQEIIEFPTLLYNIDTREIEEEFHFYIKPDVNPNLSSFCSELTGITQDQVDNGISLVDVLSQHESWLFEKEFLPRIRKDGSSCSFKYLTCGDWDLKMCLPRQLDYHQLQMPNYFKSYINIKEDFRQLYERRNRLGMKGMLNVLDMEIVGRHHSGIDDCRNLARIRTRMLEDGWEPSIEEDDQ
jgi:ERI1 exoribonuclease 3